MYITESISKSRFKLSVINTYLLTGLIAVVVIIVEMFYIGISVTQRLESTMLTLNILLPSKNIDK